MKLPVAWNDPDIMKEAPLQDWFCAMSKSGQQRGSEKQWIKRIAEDVFKTNGGPEAAQKWHSIAFLSPAEAFRDLPITSTTDPRLEIFVNVLWHLHSCGEGEARKCMHQESKARGYMYFPPADPRKRKKGRSHKSHPIETSGDSATVQVVHSIIPDATQEPVGTMLQSVIPSVSLEEDLAKKRGRSKATKTEHTASKKPFRGKSSKSVDKFCDGRDWSNISSARQQTQYMDPARRVEGLPGLVQASSYQNASEGSKNNPEPRFVESHGNIHLPVFRNPTSPTFPLTATSTFNNKPSPVPEVDYPIVSRVEPPESIHDPPRLEETEFMVIVPPNASSWDISSITIKSAESTSSVLKKLSFKKKLPTAHPPPNLEPCNMDILVREDAPRKPPPPEQTPDNMFSINQAPVNDGLASAGGSSVSSTTTKDVLGGREPAPEITDAPATGSKNHGTKVRRTRQSSERPKKRSRLKQVVEVAYTVPDAVQSAWPQELSERAADLSPVIRTAAEGEPPCSLPNPLTPPAPIVAHPKKQSRKKEIEPAPSPSEPRHPTASRSDVADSNVSSIPKPFFPLPKRRKQSSTRRQSPRVIHSPHPSGFPVVDRIISDAAASGSMSMCNEEQPPKNWDIAVHAEEEEDMFDFEEEDPLSLLQNSTLTLGSSALDVSVSHTKPQLPKPPPIWAKSRQEICESFDWFRSYQSGVYHTGNVVKGYLLSAFASSRDIFHDGGKLIISHGGGKAQSVRKREGLYETREAEDQLAQDKSVRALIKNHEDGRPLVLLIDDRYAKFPYDLSASGYTYAVLGFFSIVHYWAEFQPANNERGRVVRYKFAFRWCDNQGRPWWQQDGRSDEESSSQASSMDPITSPEFGLTEKVTPKKIASILTSTSSGSQALYSACTTCRMRTPCVYNEGWMCLNPNCSAFWNGKDGLASLSELNYSEKFLESLPAAFPLAPSADIRPHAPSQPYDGITTTYAYTRGWHCLQCGRLSSRSKWEHWECPNCGATHSINGRLRSEKEFWKQKISANFLHYLVAKGSGITHKGLQVLPLSAASGSVACETFELPEQRGKIHHIIANVLTNTTANDIFKQYQEQASEGNLLFRRWPLRSHKLRGPFLTNYFSQNSGEPYQYVGGTDTTVPLNEAPTAVVGALKLIQERMALLELDGGFNEVLSAGYMERQKMSFHSDSERGLGPTVASLSLGSMALMFFRLHSKFETDPNRKGTRNLLTLVLRHGDVMIMEGADIQKYYEHTVVPLNFRIAATARHIDPSNSMGPSNLNRNISNTAL